MKALEFYQTVVRDSSNFLHRLIGLLEEHGIRYCVIGGQAVNAYVEPLVTLDLDIVIAVDQLAFARSLFESEFHVREFPHSLNLSADELTSKRGALPLTDFVGLVEQIVAAHGNEKGVIQQ